MTPACGQADAGAGRLHGPPAPAPCASLEPLGVWGCYLVLFPRRNVGEESLAANTREVWSCSHAPRTAATVSGAERQPATRAPTARRTRVPSLSLPACAPSRGAHGTF